MTHTHADVALLESTLAAVEQLLANADADNATKALSAPADGGHMSPAQSSLHICLNSAAALLDVSRSLLRAPDERAPDDLEREWQTLIVLTKSASRSVYRAALIMAAERNLHTAQVRKAEPDGTLAR